MSVNFHNLAHLLKVDEVQIHHGPKGFAFSVRVQKSWLATTLDHDEIDEHEKATQFGEQLSYLADVLKAKVEHGDLKKAARSARLAMVAPIPRYEEPIRRSYYSPPPPASPRSEPISRQAPQVESPRMQSRFHAIVAELSK